MKRVVYAGSQNTSRPSASDGPEAIDQAWKINRLDSRPPEADGNDGGAHAHFSVKLFVAA